MSDSDCSNCDKECKCRDNSYDCWVLCANDMKGKLTTENVVQIKATIELLESIKDLCRFADVSNAIHPLRTMIELYEETETTIN